MGLYLKKSFRAGPFRLNISKSGVGVSAGIKGARIGVGPRGSYVHAGRNGLYYRKNLSSGDSRSSKVSRAVKVSRSPSGVEAEGCINALLGLFVTFVVFCTVIFFANNTGALVAVGLVVSIFLFLRWLFITDRLKRIQSYKDALDAAFVTNSSLPTEGKLNSIKRQQKKLPDHYSVREKVQRVEANVYQAVLDRVLDDGRITKEEAAVIAIVEKTLRLSFKVRLQTKKEIFTSAYLEVIEDRKITQDEFKKLKNLLAGLGLPKEEVRAELGMVQQIIATQNLSHPLEPLAANQVRVPIQKSEKAFFQDDAKVFSKRKSKYSPSGYEFVVQREGTLVITNKRILVVGHGTTTIKLSDITDLEVDIDKGMIEISKITSGRPVFLKVSKSLYVGRCIDLLLEACSGGKNE